jgi:co-chaperonin GroES (HSP10)
MFQPNHNLVTVVLDPKDSLTKGGLILPENFEDVFRTGTVRAVGPGQWLDSGKRARPDLNPGDRVMLAQHRAQGPGGARVIPYPNFLDDGTMVIICDATDILGVIQTVKN